MKCDKCRFMVSDGSYEYPEYECSVFGNYIPKEFITEDGCCLKFKEAQKVAGILEKIHSLQYFPYEFCDKEGNPKKYEELEEEEQIEYDKYQREYDELIYEIQEYQNQLFERYEKRKGFN